MVQKDGTKRKTTISLLNILKKDENYAMLAKYISNKNTEYIPPGYKLNTEFSNDSIVVFEKKKTIVIVYKATNLRNNIKEALKDLKSDLSIFLTIEKRNKQFRNAVNHFQMIKDEFPNSRIVLVGHSLGGNIASYLGKRFPKKIYRVVTFNKAISPIKKQEKGNKETAYANVNDIFSKKALDAIFVPKKNGIRPHSIDNYLF
jgi:triacylglycerol esterase/lipase EstA (alpha/beta hydrolase family)